jgi:hypothetical protein
MREEWWNVGIGNAAHFHSKSIRSPLLISNFPEEPCVIIFIIILDRQALKKNIHTLHLPPLGLVPTTSAESIRKVLNNPNPASLDSLRVYSCSHRYHIALT